MPEAQATPNRPGKARIVTTVAVAADAVILAACGHSLGTASNSSYGNRSASAIVPRSPPPNAASRLATHLTSPSATVQRSALTSTAASLLPPGSLFPFGARIRLDPDGWHQAGRFADATATVTSGRSNQRYEVGYMDTLAGWRVTFASPLRRSGRWLLPWFFWLVPRASSGLCRRLQPQRQSHPSMVRRARPNS